jgi:FKBP-type peptidyl-prolyl cis-trans isomerase
MHCLPPSPSAYVVILVVDVHDDGRQVGVDLVVDGILVLATPVTRKALGVRRETETGSATSNQPTTTTTAAAAAAAATKKTNKRKGKTDRQKESHLKQVSRSGSDLVVRVLECGPDAVEDVDEDRCDA